MGSSPVCERGRGCYSVLEICTGLTWACARPTVHMVCSRSARRRYPVPCTHAPAPPLRAQAWPSCAARGAGRGSSGHPRRSGVVPARRWSAKSNAHRLPKRDRARRSDAESLPTKRSCALHAASESRTVFTAAFTVSPGASVPDRMCGRLGNTVRKPRKRCGIALGRSLKV